MWKSLDLKGARLALLILLVLVGAIVVMFSSGFITVRVKLPPASEAHP